MVPRDVHYHLEKERRKRYARPETEVRQNRKYRNDSEYDSTRWNEIVQSIIAHIARSFVELTPVLRDPVINTYSAGGRAFGLSDWTM